LLLIENADMGNSQGSEPDQDADKPSSRLYADAMLAKLDRAGRACAALRRYRRQLPELWRFKL
jgi:hypothetical protein